MMLLLVSMLALLPPSLAKNCPGTGQYSCFDNDDNGLTYCSRLKFMCRQDADNPCRGLDSGYCDPEECKKHGVPMTANGRNICIPKHLLCNDNVDVGESVTKDDLKLRYDEEVCMNGGTCEDNEFYWEDPDGEGRKKCSCAEGFTGEKCETPIYPPTNVCDKKCLHGGRCVGGKCICEEGFKGASCESYDNKKELKECTKTTNQSIACSKAGHLCPFVDCPPCKPCQKDKVIKYYESGPLDGCILSEECGEKKLLKLEEGERQSCIGDSPCSEIKTNEGKGVREGCEEEICVKAQCPTKPTTSPCQAVDTLKHDCAHCNDYAVRPKTFEEAANKDEKCGDKCRKLEEEYGKCLIRCKPFEERNTCDKICDDAVTVNMNENTCSKEIQCNPKTCRRIAEEQNECIFGDAKFNFVDDARCKCPPGLIAKVKDHECEACDTITCEEEPRKCPDVVQCKRYQQSKSPECDADFKAKCPDFCNSGKNCVCSSPKSCPEEYMDMAIVDCPLTDRECKDDEKCCEKICPKKLSEGGRRKSKQCVKMDCEVCSDMEGATLYGENAGWRNAKYCNSDEECCIGCKSGKDVQACPSDWTPEKKKACQCKK